MGWISRLVVVMGMHVVVGDNSTHHTEARPASGRQTEDMNDQRPWRDLNHVKLELGEVEKVRSCALK